MEEKPLGYLLDPKITLNWNNGGHSVRVIGEIYSCVNNRPDGTEVMITDVVDISILQKKIVTSRGFYLVR